MRPIDADAFIDELNVGVKGFEAVLSRLKTDEPVGYFHRPSVIATIKLYEIIKEYIERQPTVERLRGEWISVEERLPDPFVTVLVHMPQEKPLPTVHAGYISKDGEWVGGMFKRDKDEVTHWMPLPEAPDDMRGEE